MTRLIKKIKLSIIIPFYNEARNLTPLLKELEETFSQVDFATELVFVDDGSVDFGGRIVHQFQKKKTKFARFQLLTLKRNFGQTAAIAAGIDHARGELLGFLDADLQNDPCDLVTMVKDLKSDTDAIVGWRKLRLDSHLRSIGSKIINFAISRLFDINLHDLGCATKIVRRKALAAISLYGEFHRLLPFVLHLNGLKVKEMIVHHRKRYSGQSKYKILRPYVFFDLLTLKLLKSYGTKPSGIFGFLGFLLCLGAFLPLFLTLYEKVIQGIYVHRNPLFIIAIFLFLLGIQFLSLGFLAELVVRSTFGNDKKPIYEIRK